MMSRISPSASYIHTSPWPPLRCGNKAGAEVGAGMLPSCCQAAATDKCVPPTAKTLLGEQVWVACAFNCMHPKAKAGQGVQG